MTEHCRAVVVTSDRATWDETSHVLSSLDVHSQWASSIDECRHILRRETIDLIFRDERVKDSDFSSLLSAAMRGPMHNLAREPRIILMSRKVDPSEREQARRSGVLAVVELPPRQASLEWAIVLAKRSLRETRGQ